MEANTKAEAVPLPYDSADIEALDYRRVKLTGRFDDLRQHKLGPKSLVSPKEATDAGSLFASGANTGYHVIVPFKLEGDPRTVLVNVGWIPKGQQHVKVNLGEGGRIRHLEAVVRKTEHRTQFEEGNLSGASVWTVRDVPALARILETDPIFVEAVADTAYPNVVGNVRPIPGQTRVTFRNDHFSYMVTWYALGAATFYMWLKKFILK